MIEKKTAILLIAGGGGHIAQVKRLYNLLELSKKKIDVLLLTEKGVIDNSENIEKIYFDPLRDKYSITKSILSLPVILIKHIILSINLFRDYDIKLCISTGPGVAIIPMLIGKMYNKKVIFIETWSKFEDLTFTAKIISIYADLFYVQNKELLHLSKKAIYSGRL